MALVAYDYGSESENDDDESLNKPEVITQISKNVEADSDKTETNTAGNTDKTTTTNSSIFSNLPPTKEKKHIDYEDKIEDFIPKPAKEKQKVRITIPSLLQFDSKDDEPHVKKAKPSSNCSGLLGLLPPVKSLPMSTKSFIPHSVKNKNIQKPSSTNTLVPHSFRKKSEVKKKETLRTLQKKQANAGSDIESDDDLEIPESFDDEMWEKVCGRPKPKPEIINASIPEEIIESTVNIAPEPEAPYGGLDNQAFKQLVGKTKRPLGNIKLIDINEEEILPDKDLWMTKSLTDPDMAPRASAEDQVDPTRRKKHHITYLAQQAKANEQELQSSWASSRNNRMMSRAKYGF